MSTIKEKLEHKKQERFTTIRRILMDLRDNPDVIRKPDPEESIPYLTKPGWGKFTWVHEKLDVKLEARSELTEFTLMLSRIRGVITRKCPKCSGRLPVILTVNADRYRSITWEWHTYCPVCAWIQAVREPKRFNQIPRSHQPLAKN